VWSKRDNNNKSSDSLPSQEVNSKAHPDLMAFWFHYNPKTECFENSDDKELSWSTKFHPQLGYLLKDKDKTKIVSMATFTKNDPKSSSWFRNG
jgi:hypothetical protein